MSLKSQSIPLILTLFLPIVLSAAVGGQKVAAVNGWQPIKDVNTTEVQEVAKFAVTEHNKEASANLEYEKVVKGETLIVSGKDYRLVITAKDGAASGNYLAVVWVKPWLHYRNLTSFKKFVELH